MIVRIYAVYDRKSGVYGTPFVMENDETASRSFLDSLAEVRVPTLLSKFKEDYELFRIGDYDTVIGAITAPEKPEFIANAASYGERLSALIKSNQDLIISSEAFNVAVKKYDKLASDSFKKVFAKELGSNV